MAYKPKNKEQEQKQQFLNGTAFLRKATLTLGIFSIICAVFLGLFSLLALSAVFAITDALAVEALIYPIILAALFILFAIFFFKNYFKLKNAKIVSPLTYLSFIIVVAFSVFYSLLQGNFAPINYMYIIMIVVAIASLQQALGINRAQLTTKK